MRFKQGGLRVKMLCSLSVILFAASLLIARSLSAGSGYHGGLPPRIAQRLDLTTETADNLISRAP